MKFHAHLTVNSIQQHAIAELAGIDVLEFKVEQIVYDSNFNHDSWWAS